jgi:hypothetical protein
MIRCCRAWILAGEFFFFPLANKKGVSLEVMPTASDRGLVGMLLYTPIETFDQLGHDPSSAGLQPTNERTEHEKLAVDRNNIANELHGATEDYSATMIYDAPPIQQQDRLYQDPAAPVQIPLDGTTSSIVRRK